MRRALSDGLSTKRLKSIKVALIKPLNLITTQTLNTGIFSDKLNSQSYPLANI